MDTQGNLCMENALLVSSDDSGSQDTTSAESQPRLQCRQSEHLQGRSVCTVEVWVPDRPLAAGPAQHSVSLLTA